MVFTELRPKLHLHRVRRYLPSGSSLKSCTVLSCCPKTGRPTNTTSFEALQLDRAVHAQVRTQHARRRRSSPMISATSTVTVPLRIEGSMRDNPALNHDHYACR